MENRLPMLLVTGALAFGGLGYFMFLYDDGTTVRLSTPRGGVRLPKAASSGHAGTGLGPGLPGASPAATAAKPAPPEPPAAPAETAPHENPE